MGLVWSESASHGPAAPLPSRAAFTSGGNGQYTGVPVFCHIDSANTFAVSLLLKGVDLSHVSILLGHASWNGTLVTTTFGLNSNAPFIKSAR